MPQYLRDHFEVTEAALRALLERRLVDLLRFADVLDMADHALEDLGRFRVARRVHRQHLDGRRVHARLIADHIQRPGQLVECETRPLAACAARCVAPVLVVGVPLVAGRELQVDLGFPADLALGLFGETVPLACGGEDVFIGLLAFCHVGYF